VLGVEAAAFWTLVSIVGVGLIIHSSELPAMGVDGAVTTRPGSSATRAIVFLGVLALKTVERRYADRKCARLELHCRRAAQVFHRLVDRPSMHEYPPDQPV